MPMCGEGLMVFENTLDMVLKSISQKFVRAGQEQSMCVRLQVKLHSCPKHLVSVGKPVPALSLNSDMEIQPSTV